MKNLQTLEFFINLNQSRAMLSGRGAPELPSPPSPVVGWFRMRLRMIVYTSDLNLSLSVTHR